MAGEPNTKIDADVPLPTVAQPAPPAETVSAAPAAQAPASLEPTAPAVTQPPAGAADAKPAETRPAEAKPALASDRPSLLETAAKEIDAKTAAKIEPKVEAKAADAKPAEPAKEGDKTAEAKPAEPAKVEPPAAPEPIKYDFKLPETIKADDEQMGAFTGILGEARVAPEVGQKLMDLHAAAMQRYADQVNADALANQHKVFNQTRDEWNRRIMADEVLGGAGHLTAMGAVARMRDLLVPKEMLASRKYDDGTPRLSEFEEFLRITGAGDHPVFNRILHNAARYLDEPVHPPADIKPPASNGRPPGGRRAAIYDHPSSRKS
jgi:hypothetical protein